MPFGLSVEALESRLMLAGIDPALARFGGKLEPRLWRAVQNLGKAGLGARTDAAGDVQVDLRVRGKLSTSLAALKKLGLRNNSELTRFAVKHGYVSL